MKLLENYKGRIALAEKYHTMKTGSRLDNDRKITLAACLDNTARFINESFNSSVGTQRSDLGKFKLFCLDMN